MDKSTTESILLELRNGLEKVQLCLATLNVNSTPEGRSMTFGLGLIVTEFNDLEKRLLSEFKND